MNTGEDTDVDSDLDDPDLEELELLRKALGTHYTAEGHDAGSEDDSGGDIGIEAQQQSEVGEDRTGPQRERLDRPHAVKDSAGKCEGSPDGMPSNFRQQTILQNSCQANSAADRGEGEDTADEEEEDDNEEWEPAPTRTELLRDAVQYLQQASAEQGPDGEADEEEEEPPAQVESTVSRLERALAANRRLQDRLVGILEAIDGALWSNAEMQARLVHNSWLHPRPGRYRGMRVVSNATWGEADASSVGPSQFWVAERNVPEPNADTLQVVPVFRYLPQHFKDPGWLPEETACLTEALLKAAQRADRAETAAQLASGSRARQKPPPPDKDEYNNEPALTLQAKGVESIINGFDSAAWEEIAILGPAGRTAEECWKQWTHQLRPSLNKADWTAEEDAVLLEHVNRLGTHAWDEVAAGLGTGRTPAACLAQYQRRQKRDGLLNSKWTPEEATRLAQVISRLGTRDWQAVAVELGGRTPGQVQHFYQDNLSNCYKKGAWNPEEDEALKQAVRTCGKHWREVAKHVPSRTDKQCRERFANVLDPELKLYAEWTPEEDALLLRAIEEHTQPNGKVKWAAVSRMIPGRTDHVCVRHYRMLTKGPPRQKHARAVRQRSGRFVAWEKVDKPKLLTAHPEAEALQLEGGPASAKATQTEGGLSLAPAQPGRKPRSARKPKRTKHRAQASTSREELDLEGVDEFMDLSAAEGESARPCNPTEAEGMPPGQEEPPLRTRQLPRQPSCSKGADESHAQGAKEAGGTASAKDTNPDHTQPASNPSRGRCIRTSKAKEVGKSMVQENAHARGQGPRPSEGMTPPMETRRSSRKRKAA